MHLTLTSYHQQISAYETFCIVSDAEFTASNDKRGSSFTKEPSGSSVSVSLTIKWIISNFSPLNQDLQDTDQKLK